MACACKVNKQISYIQKRYSNRQSHQKGTFSLDGAIKSITSGIVVVLLSPLMLLHVVFIAPINNKPINIAKLFGLKQVNSNGRK